LDFVEKEERKQKVATNIEQNTKHAARTTQVERQVEKKGARGGDSQDAAARHQGRSTYGEQSIGIKER